MHVASGGENYVPVSMAGNLSHALVKAKEAGYNIAGAVTSGGEDINKVIFPKPLCIVFGSEGEGIRHGIEKQLELKVTIPMEGASLSVNIAMSCAIFCFELRRQARK
jgi:23S rRNA (guanosine2251-2'-O)-methyltransferase